VYSYGLHNAKIGGIDLGQILFDAYKLRAETDSGTVENDTCTITFLNNLQ
jgi:hypothetical protein